MGEKLIYREMSKVTSHKLKWRNSLGATKNYSIALCSTISIAMEYLELLYGTKGK